MRRRSNAAPVPSPETLAALYAARKRGNAATPGEQPDRGGNSCCGECRYMVTGHKIVHGAKKGDIVTLCDTGATRALVLAGHLIRVVEEEKDLTAESAGEIEEADNG
jgi:hypothetical protein